MSVREIRGWTPATPLPHAPSYVMGVINLRGAVLPINLSVRLGLKPVAPDARHVIIIGSGRVEDRRSSRRSRLRHSDGQRRKHPADAGGNLRPRTQYARGILAIDKRMICLIELDALFPDAESEAA